MKFVLLTLIAFSNAENILIIGRTLAQWDEFQEPNFMESDTIYLLDPQNLNNAVPGFPEFAVRQWEKKGLFERVHQKGNTIGIRSTLEDFNFSEELPDVFFDKVFFDWSVTKFISNGYFASEIVKLYGRLSPTGIIYVRDYVEMIPEHLLKPEPEDTLQVSFRCPCHPGMLQGTFHLHKDLTMRQVQMMARSDFAINFSGIRHLEFDNVKLQDLPTTTNIFWMPVLAPMRPLLAYEIPQYMAKIVERVNEPYPLENPSERPCERMRFYYKIPAQSDINLNENSQKTLIPSIYSFEKHLIENEQKASSGSTFQRCFCCAKRKKQ